MLNINNTLTSYNKKQLSINTKITVPGDKSISHRSMILAGIADGVSEISGFLESADCLATKQAMQSMGVKIDKQGDRFRVYGVGKMGLCAPDCGKIDCGNSGTGMRLLAGLLAAQKFDTQLFGDKSLNSRPMTRIITPLTLMGANVCATENGTAPLEFKAVKSLRAIHYPSPIASAQVKSCVLLAGLYSTGMVSVSEPKLSRDHTENMLRGFGCDLTGENLTVHMQGGQTLQATDIQVPADISSAAFFMVWALLSENVQLTLNNLCVNPSRTGVISLLKLMGGDIQFTHVRENAGEKIADVVVKSSHLHGIEIPHEHIAAAIDEFPIVFIAAALAAGETRLTGAMELRHKESDRIAVMADGLKKLGIDCAELSDGLWIKGGEFQAAHVDAQDDHRCAMSFLIAGQFAKDKITVDNCENINTSFPNFLEICQDLGLSIA